MERKDIPALTGLRYFFAVLVMMFHFQGFAHAFSDYPDLIRNIFLSGYQGVSFFFILSGFILTYRYHAVGFRDGVAPFYIARVARIYPVYVLGVVLGAVAMLALAYYGHFMPNYIVPDSVGGNVISFALQMTLSQAWFAIYALNWNSPAWSLSAEAFFYLFFPFIFMMLNTLSVRNLIGVGIVAYLGLLLCIGGLYAYNVGGLFYVPANNTRAVSGDITNLFLNHNPLVRLPEFVFGIIAGLLFVKNRTYFMPRAWAFAGVGILGLLLVSCLSGSIPLIFVRNGAFAFLACCLILGIAAGNQQRGFLRSSLLTLLGHSSYALYIIHVPVLLLLLLFVFPALSAYGSGDHINFLVFVILTTGLSVLIHLMVERPGRVLVKNKLTRRVGLSARAA